MSDQNTFLSVGANLVTRKYGTDANAAEPYVSGVFFTEWTKIPANITPVMISLGYDGLQPRQIMQVLSSLCKSVTIPGRTINKVEMQGIGGLRWSAPGQQDEDNNISMRFAEMQDMPNHRIFHAWTRMIRDNRTGLSRLRGPGQYSIGNYSGTVYYWTTNPGGADIQFASCYTGVWPTKDPSDLFGHDIASQDQLEIDIDFSVNYCWQDAWVRNNVKTFRDLRVNAGTESAIEALYRDRAI